MKLLSKSGTLDLPLTTGNFSVSGLGFTPKLVLFMSEPDTSDIVAAVANMFWSFGAFDGTDQWVRAGSSINGSAFSQIGSNCLQVSKVISIYQPPGALTFDYEVAAVSLDADGFTLNVTNAPPINYRFSYLALGGTTFQAKIGTFKSAGGGQTVSGLGFTPEAVLTFPTISFAGALPFNQLGQMWCYGYCTDPIGFSAGKNGTFGTPCNQGATPSQSKRYVDTGWSIDEVDVTGATLVGGGINSFGVGQFTTAYYANPTGYWIGYIAMAGAPDIKFYADQSGLGSVVGDAIFTGVGFTPRVGLLASVGMPNPPGAMTTDATFSMGWWANNYSTVDSQYMMMGNDYHGQSPTLTNHSSHANRVLRFVNASGVVTEDAAMKQLGSDGFTLDMKVASATPSHFGYFLVGDTDPPVPPVSPAESFGFML